MHTLLRRHRLVLGALLLLAALGGSLLLRNAQRRPRALSPQEITVDAANFALPPPQRLSPPKTLWATWYWTPTYSSTQGIPLLDEHEKPLGPALPPESFCRAAVEGATRINGQVYTFAGIGPRKETNCAPYWPTMTQAPYVRFAPSDSPYGEGVGDYYLVPYRSVAVDESQIPIGTVLYIPAARGCPLTLPDGRQVRHDGYFFAADDGYGIRGSHIDVFIGLSNLSPFPWVISRPWGTFPAYVITDPAIIAALRQAHLPPPEP